MSPTIFHHLKHHVPGWSTFYINPIDLRKIIKINYFKRLFCIGDPDYPYTLKIKYLNQEIETKQNGVFGFRDGELVLTNEYNKTSIMTVRYKSQTDVLKEIYKINQLQELIKKFNEQQNKKLIEFVNNNKT